MSNARDTSNLTSSLTSDVGTLVKVSWVPPSLAREDVRKVVHSDVSLSFLLIESSITSNRILQKESLGLLKNRDVSYGVTILMSYFHCFSFKTKQMSEYKIII